MLSTIHKIFGNESLSKTKILTSLILFSMFSANFSYAETYHIIEKNEHLQKLSERFGVSIDSLVEVNNIKNPELLAVGQKLIIPYPNLKTVDGKKIIKLKPQKVKAKSQSRLKNTKKDASKSTAIEYKIKRHDTLRGIANRHSVSLADIAKINNVATDYKVFYGDFLLIPDGKAKKSTKAKEVLTHKVVAGEGLERISKKYQVTQAEVIKLNGLDADNIMLKIGQVLKIPNKSSDKDSTAIASVY